MSVSVPTSSPAFGANDDLLRPTDTTSFSDTRRAYRPTMSSRPVRRQTFIIESDEDEEPYKPAKRPPRDFSEKKAAGGKTRKSRRKKLRSRKNRKTRKHRK